MAGDMVDETGYTQEGKKVSCRFFKRRGVSGCDLLAGQESGRQEVVAAGSGANTKRRLRRRKGKAYRMQLYVKLQEKL